MLRTQRLLYKPWPWIPLALRIIASVNIEVVSSFWFCSRLLCPAFLHHYKS
jgi:hypothetical protein